MLGICWDISGSFSVHRRFYTGSCHILGSLGDLWGIFRRFYTDACNISEYFGIFGGSFVIYRRFSPILAIFWDILGSLGDFLGILKRFFFTDPCNISGSLRDSLGFRHFFSPMLGTFWDLLGSWALRSSFTRFYAAPVHTVRMLQPSSQDSSGFRRVRGPVRCFQDPSHFNTNSFTIPVPFNGSLQIQPPTPTFSSPPPAPPTMDNLNDDCPSIESFITWLFKRIKNGV